MYSLEVRVGRLLECRIHRLSTLADAQSYAADALKLMSQTAGPLVLCADHRRVRIYSQGVADLLANLFKQMNPGVERVAILVARSNSTLSLQVERIVREAKNPDRQVFYDVPPALAYLEPSLDAAERARLDQFLGEPLPTP